MAAPTQDEGPDFPPLDAYHEEGGEPAKNVKLNGSNSLEDIVYQRIADVKAKPINWLWPGRLARGKFSIIVGNAGLGKSQVCCSLAAITSKGGFWPVDRTEAYQGSVIILSAEDDVEDTIRPRLEAAGADLDNVYILEAISVEDDKTKETKKRSFNLAADTTRLAALMQHIKDESGLPVALVIIDPISAYLGNADSHNNAEVRALLSPLQYVAAKHQAAMLGVSHLTKAQGVDALLRLQGSVAFGAAARSVWGIAKDKDDPQRRLMLPLKNNLGKDDTGFAYSLQSFLLEGSEPPIGTSHVMWEKEKVTISAEEAFAQGAKDFTEHSMLDDAKAFLRDFLANGAQRVDKVEREAKRAGVSAATLKRAKVELRLIAAKQDFEGPWEWRLPQQ